MITFATTDDVTNFGYSSLKSQKTRVEVVLVCPQFPYWEFWDVGLLVLKMGLIGEVLYGAFKYGAFMNVTNLSSFLHSKYDIPSFIKDEPWVQSQE